MYNAGFCRFFWNKYTCGGQRHRKKNSAVYKDTQSAWPLPDKASFPKQHLQAAQVERNEKISELISLLCVVWTIQQRTRLARKNDECHLMLWMCSEPVARWVVAAPGEADSFSFVEV